MPFSLEDNTVIYIKKDLMTMKKILLVFASFYKKSDLPEKKRIFWEPLGIAYLASYLRNNNYQVDIFFPLIKNMEEHDIKQWLYENISKYSLVGLSTADFTCTSVKKYVSFIKELQFSGRIIVGGLGPTCNWREFVFPGIDAVVIGEGEKTVLKIANSIRDNTSLTDIEGIAYLKNGTPYRNGYVELIENLDDNVFPARDISEKFLEQFDINQIHIQIQTSRGCLGKCSFCSIANFLQEQGSVKYRERSVENIVSEIAYLNSRYGFKKFDFMDENFFPFSPTQSVEKCKRLILELNKNHYDIQLFVQCHLKAISFELLELLSSINVTSIFVGIDSFQTDELFIFNKNYSRSDVMAFLELVNNSPYSFNISSKYRMKTGFINFTPISSLNMLYENGIIFKQYNFSCKKLIRKLKMSVGNLLLLERIRKIFPDFSEDNYFMYPETSRFYKELTLFYELYEEVRGNLRNIENIYMNDVNSIPLRMISDITTLREKTDELFFDYYFCKLNEIRESTNYKSNSIGIVKKCAVRKHPKSKIGMCQAT